MDSELLQKPFWKQKGNYCVSSELFLDLIFTSACNARCPFCIARTEEHGAEDFPRWKRTLARTLEEFDVRSIILLGGEATIDPRFWEKLAYLAELTAHRDTGPLILTTNGIALREERFLERLCASQIDSVNISYMHHRKTVNDAIFGLDTLRKEEVAQVYHRLRDAGKTMRLNANVYRGNLDTVTQMEDFVRYFSGCCDTIKFSPLIATDMFHTVESVTRYTRAVAIPDAQIRILYDAFAAEHTCLQRAQNILGFVDYCSLSVYGQHVILKYAQVEDKYDRDRVIPTLKLYPNGNVSNEWDHKKTIFPIG